MGCNVISAPSIGGLGRPKAKTGKFKPQLPGSYKPRQQAQGRRKLYSDKVRGYGARSLHGQAWHRQVPEHGNSHLDQLLLCILELQVGLLKSLLCSRGRKGCVPGHGFSERNLEYLSQPASR